MLNTEFQIDGCKIVVESPATVRIEGMLMYQAQLAKFETDIKKVSELLKSADSGIVVIDISKCDKCISIILKSFLLWIKHITAISSGLKLIVAREEEETLPWHETVIGCIEHFNTDCIPLEIEFVELD